jgi:type IV fimbrial biogenesis protein FimT
MDTVARDAGVSLSRRAYADGLTLIELLTTVVIVAILFAVAVPSFRNASLGSRLSASANDLLASVQLARSEAIKRNVAVTLCASADGVSCAGSGGWEQGWITVINPLGVATVLQHQQSLPDGYLLTQAGGTAGLDFRPIGIGATAAVFTVCRDDPDGSQERVVNVTATGSAYVTRTETGSCS